MQDYNKLVEALRGHLLSVPLSLLKDAADAIEALQAEVERLKDSNEELHAELQKWVSAAEKAGEPKWGKWIDGDGRRVTARCSVCGKWDGWTDWNSQPPPRGTGWRNRRRKRADAQEAYILTYWALKDYDRKNKAGIET